MTSIRYDVIVTEYEIVHDFLFKILRHKQSQVYSNSTPFTFSRILSIQGVTTTTSSDEVLP
jgi:hypothetical protein